MATWNTNTGWQVFSYPTNEKTNYTANDFVSSYPNKNASAFYSSYPDRTANDYASTYPANRETSRPFWVKRENGEIVDISWDPKSGPNWNQRTLSTGSLNDQFGNDFVNALGKFRDNLQNKRDALKENSDANNNDLNNRQNAANQFNAQQVNNRQNAANEFNAQQVNNRQNEANQFNANNLKTNQKNQALNTWSSKVANYSSNVQAGTYLNSKEKLPVAELDDLRNKGVLSSSEYNSFLNIVKNSFDNYYLKQKVGEPWDAVKLGALDPAGKFNASDYAQYNPDAVKRWEDAIKKGDLDITARYTKDTFLWQDYTSYGKFAGYRGSKPVAETETAAYKYKETLTDYEKQLYRDQVLGITTDATGNQRIVLATPQYDSEGNLINEPDVNTLLERTFAQNISTQDTQKEKQLGALAQDLLKVSIDELKKAKQKESNLTLLGGLPGYSEIMNINTTLANSIIGDSGIGGMLSLMGGGKDYEKGIEKSIAGITGINANSTVYNWQKWFDETLLKRYENYEVETRTYGEDELKRLQKSAQEEINAYNQNPSLAKPIYLEIAEKYKQNGNPLNVNNMDDFKKIMFNIDMESKKEFVDTFIKDYIKPRFDQSKSMDEFISYLNVQEDEQNVFQSQTTINKLKQIADLRSKTFLDLIQSSEKVSASFNPDFYLDPLSNKTKEIGANKIAQYQLQKDLIASDFENAKKDVVGSDGINWAIEAYRYGFENTYKTDPLVFAKLHYQAKGSTGMVKDAQGKAILLDPAEDILPYEELAQKIKDFGVEMAARREFYGGAGFMEFVTPEEFADAVLGSISPEENKEEWEKVLASIGLEGADATIDQVKEYLVEQLRTEEAQNIRESIKYLNENEQELNQKTLGASYIERPTDVQKVTGDRTVLYDVFKNAGYGGSEDEFYNEFFPDVDRTEQQVISKITSGKGLESAFGDINDPFSAFTSVSSLFGEDDTSVGGSAFVKDQEEEDRLASAQSSYFKIFEDDDENLPEKSTAATSFLNDFTSLFKGFS
jgi:hypothetical protein